MTSNHYPHEAEPGGAARKVFRGIMTDLEEGRMVPGQRLAETDLAPRFGVGRNAVREAMHQLAARGVVDLNPNRSPMIRWMDFAEVMEVIEVASVMTRLVARTAAAHFDPVAHGAWIATAHDNLVEADRADEPAMFSKARRNFYRMLLVIGKNRELQRLFPAIGMHIIYAQYQSRQLRGLRLSDYSRILAAVSAGDVEEADRAGEQHVRNVAQVIRESRDALSGDHATVDA